MSMFSSGVNPGVIALWAIEADQAAWERRAKRRRRHREAPFEIRRRIGGGEP